MKSTPLGAVSLVTGTIKTCSRTWGYLQTIVNEKGCLLLCLPGSSSMSEGRSRSDPCTPSPNGRERTSFIHNERLRFRTITKVTSDPFRLRVKATIRRRWRVTTLLCIIEQYLHFNSKSICCICCSTLKTLNKAMQY